MKKYNPENPDAFPLPDPSGLRGLRSYD